MSLARITGTIGYLLATRDRKVALANLKIAFGNSLTDQQRILIAKESFVTACRLILDLLWFSRWTEKRLARWTIYDESLRQTFASGGQLLVSAHFGNWEMLGLMLPWNGNDGTSIAKPLRNPVVDKFINNIRTCTGQKVVYDQGGIRAIISQIKDGGCVCLVIDQDTRPEDGGVFVDFFGLPAPISGGAAVLALRLNLSVNPIFCTVDSEGVYHAYTKPTIVPKPGESQIELTRRVASSLLDEINNHPGCWLWMYKRWKRLIPGYDRSRYPFYASEELLNDNVDLP